MGLSTAVMVYGACLYMFPTLTVATTVGTVSFVGSRVVLPLIFRKKSK